MLGLQIIRITNQFEMISDIDYFKISDKYTRFNVRSQYNISANSDIMNRIGMNPLVLR